MHSLSKREVGKDELWLFQNPSLRPVHAQGLEEGPPPRLSPLKSAINICSGTAIIKPSLIFSRESAFQVLDT